MCIWPCRAAHHFSSSYCLKKKYLMFICFVSEPRVPREAWRDGLVTSPSCQGEVQPVQRLSLSWGISGVLPALQAAVQMDYCAISSSATSSFAFCGDSAASLWSHHAPRAQGSARCCAGAVPWPSLKCAYRACPGLLSAAVACGNLN